MSKITYENKEQLNTNENIPAKNKCMASDLNEIKEVVNENDTNALYNTNVKTSQTNSDTDVYSCNYVNEISKDVYSTSEVKTNKIWIDGKPIYRKTISGITATGTYNPQISNFDELVDVYGSAKIVNSNWEPLPRGAIAGTETYSMAIGSISGTTLYVEIGTFYTSKIEKSYVTIEYTKTTE